MLILFKKRNSPKMPNVDNYNHIVFNSIMPKSKTKEQFIEKACKIHGDKYDYSKVNYINNKTKVCIICPIHGEFWVRPDNHISSKCGCPVCSKNNFVLNNKTRKTIETVLSEFNKLFNYKYDYSKFIEYKNNKQIIDIYCHCKDTNGVEHGYFRSKIIDHLHGHGCPKCYHELQAKRQRLSTSEFIDKANIIHNFKYYYNKTNYIDTDTEVIITCPIHGDFLQKPKNHLQGKGCKKCKMTKGEFIIYSFLTEKKVSFEYNKTFKWLLYNNTHQYVDFYLSDYNLVIEYQGQQHFSPVDFGNRGSDYAKEQFNITLERDKNKKSLCNNNDIIVEYINYSDNIIERMKDIIVKYNISL